MLGSLSIPHYRTEIFSVNSSKAFLSLKIGENVMGADNQQERLDCAWLVGFVDGEGCFHVGINSQPKMSLGWQILPEFRIVQHQRDEALLYKIKDFFAFGNVCKNHGDRKEFRVRGAKNLNQIVSFFKKHPLQTTKRKDFEIFAQVIFMMNKKEHLTKEGLQKIAILASTMNRQVTRSRILRDYTPNTCKREDIVRSA